MTGGSPEAGVSVRTGETRAAVRHRSYFHGKIVSRDGSFSMDCVIRNLSNTGARIQVHNDELFPVRFFLLCTSVKRTFEAEVAWRRGSFAGVAFRAIHDMTAVLPHQLRIVEQFYNEHRARTGSCL